MGGDMATYEEALAKQQGRTIFRQSLEVRRKQLRNLIGIRTYVKKDIPAGVKIFIAFDHKTYQPLPCAHIALGEEEGDLLQAQIALIGPSALPEKEAANDNP